MTRHLNPDQICPPVADRAADHARRTRLLAVHAAAERARVRVREVLAEVNTVLVGVEDAYAADRDFWAASEAALQWLARLAAKDLAAARPLPAEETRPRRPIK